MQIEHPVTVFKITSVEMMNPGGTGSPKRNISHRLAPLLPSKSEQQCYLKLVTVIVEIESELLSSAEPSEKK